MNPQLNQIVSIINGFVNAKDSDRVFTYIEFVKMFGYENDTNTFISVYKDYVTAWSAVKKSSIHVSDKDFVMSKMVDILKSITLDYSNYEEQDFIAHIDLTNKNHLKALSALYSRKIRQITEFYRKKRNEAVTVVRKNSMKGSVKSIEQIIYEKVFDFVFSNRNIVPSYKNIKRDLLISVENYVDTYSQYFDIPRQKEFTDKSRAEMLSANMNDVDYRVYLEIELVISQILFSGNVYLQEIPLIAQIGVDLSQSCVGDMLALKNNLMANTQVNQVQLNEQVALKRRLFQKFLGCDLWWMYVDLQGNITMDVLCRAKNPTGNLLNCGTADTATIENQELELLSHIGLFFKPDKSSILKVNAKDYTWTVDTDVIQNDTMYVFPDPSRYGDIGNNKMASYPLIMQYKLDYDIRNLSSGEAANDPMMYITDQGWYSYYSKQEDDFKNIDNKDYEYIFTWLANRGFITNYQQDIWGNHFGILKGVQIVYKTDDKGNHILDENGNKIIDKIIIQQNQLPTVITGQGQEISGEALLLNGGYFENPFYQGEKKEVTIVNTQKGADQVGEKNTKYHYKDRVQEVPFKVKRVEVTKKCDNGNSYTINQYRRVLPGEENTDSQLWWTNVRHDVSVQEIRAAGTNWKQYYVPYRKVYSKWVYNNDETKTQPFDFTKSIKLTDTYRWSGISINNNGFFHPTNTNFINYGNFERNLRYPSQTTYEDNFMKTNILYQNVSDNKDIITDVILEFATNNVFDNSDIKIQKKSSSLEQIKQAKGQFYVKVLGDLFAKPQKLEKVFNWLNWDELGDVISFSLVRNTLILETNKYFCFVPYTYDGQNITSTLGIKQLYKIKKANADFSKIFFVEDSYKVYVLQTKIYTSSSKTFIVPTIYVFDPINYTFSQKVDFLNVAYKNLIEEKKISKNKLFWLYIDTKRQEVLKYDNYKSLLTLLDGNNQYDKLSQFELPYNVTKEMIRDVVFSYNSTLNLFLLSFIVMDMNQTPYLYQYKFKCDTMQYFHDSLMSSIYTIKKVVNANDAVIGVNYIYNDTLKNPTISSMFPIWQDRNRRIFVQE